MAPVQGGTEVEIKVRVPDRGALIAALIDRGLDDRGTRDQEDVYFGHPTRDFAATDEALRLRSEGGRWELTYKGPVTSPDAKVREEIDLPLDDPSNLRTILVRLGFTEVATVRKVRREFRGEGVTVAVDEVDGLGSFAEVEVICGPDNVKEATLQVHAFLGSMGLDAIEDRTYLGMLLGD